jgi:uncharacterized membrane protein
MNKMLVAVFDAEPAAYQGLSALKSLHTDGDITLHATAVVVKDSIGAVSVKQTADNGPVGTAVGVLTGGLVGLLGGPVGFAVGASAGAVTGMLVDIGKQGVDVGFLDEVSKAMIPGKAAVIADVEETWETPVNTSIEKHGGLVFRRIRSEVAEDQLDRDSKAFHAELKELEEELKQANAETKATLQKQIAAVREKLAVTQAQAKSKAEQVKKEADAKIEAMREQMKQAGDRRKAKIEKRIAEVQADHAVRSAKLEQAAKLAKEALAPRQAKTASSTTD